MLSRFSPVRLFATQWTVALQAPLSIGFSRQENWGGLPCPPPGDLPGPGIETMSLTPPALASRFFNTWLRVRNLVKSSGERRGLAGSSVWDKKSPSRLQGEVSHERAPQPLSEPESQQGRPGKEGKLPFQRWDGVGGERGLLTDGESRTKDGSAEEHSKSGSPRRSAGGAGVPKTRFPGGRKAQLPPHHLRLLLL